MKFMYQIFIITFLLSILSVLYVNFLYAELPSSNNYIIQQWGFASGNDQGNPPTSTNYIHKGSAIGVISGDETTSANYNNLPGYYLGKIIGDILPPENVTITVVNDSVNITWSPVSGATSYKAYSSDNPQTSFIEDTSGSFSGTSWLAPLPENKKFYYIKAFN